MNDWYKEREGWLATLKEGDQVACKTRPLGGIGHNYGYKVFRITKITDKRTRFDVVGPDSEHHSFSKDGSYRIGASQWSHHIYRLEPLTPEVYEDIKKDTMLIRADNRRYRLTKKMEELRNTFKEKGPDFHLEFVGASEQLLQLLDKHTKPDPEDA